MVKGGSPATDIWAGGLRSGGHHFLALLTHLPAVRGNYSRFSALHLCCQPNPPESPAGGVP